MESNRRMERVVRYTKFANNPYGDGGSKRSVQIEEFWKQQGAEFIDEKFPLPKQYSKLKAVKWCFRAVRFITKHIGWKKFPMLKDKFNAILAYALRLPAIYDKYKGQEVVFLWENTNDVAALFLMKAAGAKVIGYPHNLESLVPTQVDPLSHMKAPYWLLEEVECLQLCDEVYCISREETWLLSLFGINAHYYPYYPPKQVEEQFLQIRAHRESKATNSSKSYLLLGSATNWPTRQGMELVLSHFDDVQLPFRIIVAGYGTDTLLKTKNQNIVCLGALSQEQLEQCLVATDGIIIYQNPTSGALTRIAEMNVASVPVYANFAAARSYFECENVHVYDDFEHLYMLLIER